MDRKYRGYKSYEEQVEAMRASRLRKEAERDKKRRKLERILDPIAYLILTVALLAIVTLDSDSWVPAIALGLSMVYLAIYGAWRGVLG